VNSLDFSATGDRQINGKYLTPALKKYSATLLSFVFSLGNVPPDRTNHFVGVADDNEAKYARDLRRNVSAFAGVIHGRDLYNATYARKILRPLAVSTYSNGIAPLAFRSR